MHSKGKPSESLKLQTYKVDSQVLASKINELNDLKSQLENTLSKHRTQENSILDELDQLKAENQKLRAIVSDLQFTKKSQAYLILQLEKRLELEEKKTLAFSQRFEKEAQEKEQLKEFYEQKIRMLNKKFEDQDGHNIPQSYEVSKVIQYTTGTPHPPFAFSDKSISSIAESSKCQSNKKIKKLKKPSIQSESPIRPSLEIANKYQSPNIILENEEDSHLSGQDAYFQMIRQLYKQLLKIQIRASELFKIPQIEAFSRVRNPSKNDLAKLCRSYPLHINETHKVDLIFEFISKQSERRGILLTGRFIIDEIIQQIEEIECSQEMQSQADLSSCTLEEVLYRSTHKSEKINGGEAVESRGRGVSKKVSLSSANDSASSSYY